MEAGWPFLSPFHRDRTFFFNSSQVGAASFFSSRFSVPVEPPKLVSIDPSKQASWSEMLTSFSPCAVVAVFVMLSTFFFPILLTPSLGRQARGLSQYRDKRVQRFPTRTRVYFADIIGAGMTYDRSKEKGAFYILPHNRRSSWAATLFGR